MLYETCLEKLAPIYLKKVINFNSVNIYFTNLPKLSYIETVQ